MAQSPIPATFVIVVVFCFSTLFVIELTMVLRINGTIHSVMFVAREATRFGWILSSFALLFLSFPMPVDSACLVFPFCYGL